MPATASDQDKFDYQTGVRRETARNTRIYAGSLTKSGAGTLFLTGNDSWSRRTTVTAGKLSVNGGHAGPIDVESGTLGGKGPVSPGTPLTLISANSVTGTFRGLPHGALVRAGGQLTWSAPISNDAVTLEYKQSIGANDPLRTGAYAKTLTYSLSTTTP